MENSTGYAAMAQPGTAQTCLSADGQGVGLELVPVSLFPQGYPGQLFCLRQKTWEKV